jgi:phosphate transport system protein
MTHLQEELKYLRESLSEMAKLVGKQLEKSYCAIKDRDPDLANEVLFNEKRVNASELKIDKDCEHIFALLNPVAHDMRFVFATLKINADLERIGDYAEGIAKLGLLADLNFDPSLLEKLELQKMHDTALEMMRDVTKAYCDDDTKLARSVFTKDQVLNDINIQSTEVVAAYLKNNLDKIPPALYLLSIIRKMERVGDHITNIAEEVIFYKEAKVMRHWKKRDDNDELEE